MKWTDNLSVGSIVVDDQHKKLFETIDNLMVACNERRGSEVIKDTLVFLYEYTKTHFRDEEKLLQDNNYPMLDAHKLSHKKFTDEIHKAIVDYNKNGANLTVVLNVLSKCNEWLIKHIMVMDKEYARYLKQKNLKF